MAIVDDTLEAVMVDPSIDSYLLGLQRTHQKDDVSDYVEIGFVESLRRVLGELLEIPGLSRTIVASPAVSPLLRRIVKADGLDLWLVWYVDFEPWRMVRSVALLSLSGIELEAGRASEDAD